MVVGAVLIIFVIGLYALPDASADSDYSQIKFKKSVNQIIEFDDYNIFRTTITIENNDNQKLQTYNEYLRTNTGVYYESSASFDLGIGDKSCPFTSIEINPGLKKEFVFCFQIPKSETNFDFILLEGSYDWCTDDNPYRTPCQEKSYPITSVSSPQKISYESLLKTYVHEFDNIDASVDNIELLYYDDLNILTVDLSIFNKGNTEFNGYLVFVKAKNSAGYEFDTTWYTDIDCDRGIDSINPGLTKKSKLCFDVPKNENAFDIILRSGFGFDEGFGSCDSTWADCNELYINIIAPEKPSTSEPDIPYQTTYSFITYDDPYGLFSIDIPSNWYVEHDSKNFFIAKNDAYWTEKISVELYEDFSYVGQSDNDIINGIESFERQHCEEASYNIDGYICYNHNPLPAVKVVNSESPLAIAENDNVEIFGMAQSYTKKFLLDDGKVSDEETIFAPFIEVHANNDVWIVAAETVLIGQEYSTTLQDVMQSFRLLQTEITVPSEPPASNFAGISESESKSKSKPSFVDEEKDPWSYISRYNNEPQYKDWFDTNYSEWTIYEAVGLKNPASFVDQDKDPSHYVKRYLNEPTYVDWFNENFPNYKIHEAIGISQNEYMKIVDELTIFSEPTPEPTPEPTSEPTPVQVAEPEPVCGQGTILRNGICVIENQNSEKGGGCLIATAAFGSEMAPQVQFLRELRDNTVMSTQSGTAFMTGFNQFYYSFSPQIADYERENPVFKEAVKVTLTPLLTSLTLLNYVEIDSEEEMLGYGIGTILLNVGMYFVAPAVLVIALKNRLKK